MVHGQKWPPGRPLTLVLQGVKAPAQHIYSDDYGNFVYQLNKIHEFFRGHLPPGSYLLVVTGPGGRPRVSAYFSVASG